MFGNKKKKLNILFVTSEAAPFAKVGGLGEVMFSLPRALRARGHDVRVILPRYGSIDPRAHKLSLVYEGLEVPTAPQNGGKRLTCNVLEFKPSSDPRSPVTTYFLENQEYYELRSNVYGYIDDGVRFALLSRGALEFLNLQREWMPEIIVAADWMTGFLPNFLKTDYRAYQRLREIAAIFSIHNLSSQGIGENNHKFKPEMEQDDGHSPIPDFFDPRLRQINSMRRGIMYADLIHTVSAAYAREIMTEEFGEGLDALLRERRSRIYGILNGIDYETINPAADPFIPHPFSSKNLEARLDNKPELQKRFGLPQDKDKFLIGIVSRLTKQKGFDLLPPIVESFLKTAGAQLIVLGTGSTEYMEFFHALETKFPEQVRTHLQFSEELPRLIFAGADAILIPSHFEPSGLTQMEAMRYGAVPVARKVGGLADTIEDFVPEENRGTGFLFNEPDPTALLIALVRCYVNWRHHSSWRKLQKRVMEKDFSWNRSAKEYETVFEEALRAHKEEQAQNKSSGV